MNKLEKDHLEKIIDSQYRTNAGSMITHNDKAATSCALITKEYAEKFATWIGEKRCNDDWFRYDETLKTWYIHMKGHLTTSELWDIFLNDLNEKA